MRVLVTGGAGYIGGVVAQRLVEHGYDVIVLDDLSNGHRDAVPVGACFLQGDVRDVADLVDLSRVDGVVHLAARSLVGESMVDASGYWAANVGVSLALLEALRAAEVPRLVFSSTAAVYGDPIHGVASETSATQPVNPYGASKLAIDMAITGYASAYSLAAASLRYFNVAGAHAGLTERHLIETHLIPLALRAADGTGGPLRLFGNDYPTPDGTAIRDFVHVTDLADAHIRALERVVPGEHTVCNLGNGRGASVREVLNAVADVTGFAVPSRLVERRAGDAAVLVASIDKAKDWLQWQPMSSALHMMVEDAWQMRRAA